MLQIITYLLGIYLVVKGVQVLQTGLASSRENRGLLIAIGVATLITCSVSAAVLVSWQDEQAKSMSRN